MAVDWNQRDSRIWQHSRAIYGIIRPCISCAFTHAVDHARNHTLAWTGLVVFCDSSNVHLWSLRSVGFGQWRVGCFMPNLLPVSSLTKNPWNPVLVGQTNGNNTFFNHFQGLRSRMGDLISASSQVMVLVVQHLVNLSTCVGYPARVPPLISHGTFEHCEVFEIGCRALAPAWPALQ